MEQRILEALTDAGENYLLPFLWMRGEEESVLRKELEKIAECGIGAVCLESRPHPDFAGPGWWHDLDIVIDEAKKRDLKIYILDDAHFPTGQANGTLPKKYPERAKRYLSVKTFDVVGPKVHADLDIHAAMQKNFSWMDIGKTPEPLAIDEKELISVIAAPLLEGDTVGEKLIDLTAEVKDGRLTADFAPGAWRVFVVHTTTDEGARNEYINMVDRESVQVLIEANYEPHYERYKDEFGKTIAGFFSDEPSFTNTFGFAMDEKLGKRMMPLPWSSELRSDLENRLGSRFKKDLFRLWYGGTDENRNAEVRYIYMDIASQLYRKNFSEQLGEWCRERNVVYIGHVIEDNNEHSHLGDGAGHYFRAMSGQDWAGVDDIGGQVVPGNPVSTRHGFGKNDGEFCHHTLTTLGASSALFDTKKAGRLMCEAFGAYGWSFGVRDMKWVADHLISRGVNRLVPHAFSMAEYPDGDCPPHFYAHGHNPEFPYFGKLMRYCNRLCHVFSGGKWMPEVGILYDAEADWSGEAMRDQVPARSLYEAHISYAFLPIDAVSGDPNYQTEVKDETLVVNGVSLKAIVVPHAEFLDSRFASFLSKHPSLPVLFVDDFPKGLVGGGAESAGLLDLLKKLSRAVPLSDLRGALTEAGVNGAPVAGSGWEHPAQFFHYQTEQGENVVMIFNESLSETLKGDLTFPLDKPGTSIYGYEAMKNRVIEIPQQTAYNGESTVLSVELPPYESIVLFAAEPSEVAPYLIPTGQVELFARGLLSDGKNEEIFDLSNGWQTTTASGCEESAFSPVTLGNPMAPVSDVLPKFSGRMRYAKNLTLSRTPKLALLSVEHLYENARVFVNGEESDSRLCPPYRFDLAGALKEGENTIVVEVANTPLRDALNYDAGFLGHEKGFYEPSGMFGKITLTIYD